MASASAFLFSQRGRRGSSVSVRGGRVGRPASASAFVSMKRPFASINDGAGEEDGFAGGGAAAANPDMGGGAGAGGGSDYYAEIKRTGASPIDPDSYDDSGEGADNKKLSICKAHCPAAAPRALLSR